jgi:integrase
MYHRFPTQSLHGLRDLRISTVEEGDNVPKVRLTKEAIDAFQSPAPGADGSTRQVLYYDTEQPGLGVRVTSGGARVYVAEASPGGRTVRVKLGRVCDLTLSQARQRARVTLGEMASGVNPNEKRRADRARSVTLAEAFEEYVSTRKARKKLAERTEYDYRRILYGAKNADGSHKFNGMLSPWRATALSEITHDMILRKHTELLKKSPAQANYAMRLVSAVYNFTRPKYRMAGSPLLTENPVTILKDMKAWCRIDRRSTVIRAHELEAWFNAVRGANSTSNYNFAPVVRDYLQFLVLTGLRRGECARLKWEDVDLKAKVFTVRDTKNGEDHTLPLSDYLVELVEARAKDAATADLTKTQREYVFHGGGAAGYLVEPKKILVRVRAESGVEFTLHDLRRTFSTVAEGLDIPAYALKRLLNHKMKSDVTAGYIVKDVERLRAPMQKITDFMLKAAGIRESATVIEHQFGERRSA